MTATEYPFRTARRARSARPWFIAAAVLITLYGALLRFEALVANYGHLGQPRWSLTLERYAVPVARALRPDHIVWGPIAVPYVGSDPINYIKYAREMRHFYQAHVREPVFLAATRAYLRLTGGRDISVSFASATASALAVLATCLLGAAAWSRVVGLAAGLALAVEFQVIASGIEGWRDDTFMLFVVVTAWRVLRIADDPTPANGALAGVAAAAACLTRITAVTFVAPAFAWLWIAGYRDKRHDVRHAAVMAALVCAALVAPYLVNCWRATGDPLLAINYHTRYYRSAEGLPLDESIGAGDYVRQKLTTRPVWSMDTGAQGLVTVPFGNKWVGFAQWHDAVAVALRCSAAAGLLLAVWSPRGRLLLVILLGSLVPYALMWPIGGGGEWRFTLHAYPFYLIFAFAALSSAVRAMAAAMAARRLPVFSRAARLRIAATAAAIVAGWLLFKATPWFIAREALAAGDAAMITAGDRDELFFSNGWSAPVPDDIVTVRIAQAEQTTLRVPLVPGTDTWMTIRMDPPEIRDEAFEPRVAVFVNRHPLGEFDLTRTPGRMGSYRIRIPGEFAERSSRLELMASHTVPAGQAGAPFAALPADSPVAFRLWYVRLEAAGPE